MTATASDIRRADERRAIWNQKKGHCAIHWLMGQTVPNDKRGPHHLTGRMKKRPDLYELPWNWLAICCECHRKYHNGEISHETMALAKCFDDPSEFDLLAMAERCPEKFGRLLPFKRPRN